MMQACANHGFATDNALATPYAAGCGKLNRKLLYLQCLRGWATADQVEELSNQPIIRVRPVADFHRIFHRADQRKVSRISISEEAFRLVQIYGIRGFSMRKLGRI